MQRFEAIEVIEHRFSELINRFIIRRGGGDQSGFHAEGGHVLRVTLIHAAGDRRVRIERVTLEQCVDILTFDRNQLGAAIAGDFLNQPVWVTRREHHRIQLTFAELFHGIGRLQFGGGGKAALTPAFHVHQRLHDIVHARALIPDIDALTLQVGKLFNPTIFGSSNGKHLTMKGKY